MKELTSRFAKIDGWLARLGRAQFLAFATLVALGASLVFFCPKFWLMGSPRVGTFEWDRALTFLHQCRDPFANDIEGAMRWRFLPALVARGLGLSGWSALLIPYVGLVTLFVYWTATAERLLRNRLNALLLTILLGTTGAVISITSVYGLNDAWFLIGLIALSAGRGKSSLILPGLLAPWVDERFLLGWAGALFCRWWLQGRPADFWRQVLTAGASLIPYVLIRVGYTLLLNDRGSTQFLEGALSIIPAYLPYGRIGWWMGFRLAWVLPLIAIYQWWVIGGRSVFNVGVGVTLIGWLAVTVLAADLSRSTNLLLPLMLCGAVALRDLSGPERSRNWLAGLAAANLVLPYQTVTYTHIAQIWALPLELLRLFKNHP